MMTANSKPKIYLALVAFALFFLAHLIPKTQTFELQALDVFRARHQAYPQITILAIDDASLQAVGKFPWPRQMYAQILDKLIGAQPSVLGFDINFFENSDTANDTAFQQALHKAAFPVVLSSTAVYNSGSTQPARLTQPLPIFTESSNVSIGYTNTPSDGDGLVRHLPTTLTINGQTVLPFSLAIAKKAGIEFNPNQSGLVNFAGPAGTFRTIPIIDLLQDKIDPNVLKDNIILIGASASDLHDFVYAPVAGQVLAGTEWHANVIDNEFYNNFVRAVPNVLALILGLILGLVLLIASIKLPARKYSLAALGLVILLLLASFGLWHTGIALPYLLNALLLVALYALVSLYDWYIAERERRKLRQTLQLYFSPAVVKLLTENPDQLKLGGERREITILFSDIRGFTTITEGFDPEMLSELLHEYFTEMTEEILNTDGVLDKFIGDAVMAFWGAPFTQEDQADRAVTAALGMMRRLKELQKKWAAKGWPLVDIGVGINTGIATVGNMGSAKRFDYTVIGDCVNAASRMEGLNKDYKTNIIISQSTKDKLTMEVPTRPLGGAQVKGKTKSIEIFEVLL